MKKEKPYPPKLFLRFFRWYCHPKMQDYIEGDLMEVYERRLKGKEKRKNGFGNLKIFSDRGLIVSGIYNFDL